MLEDYFKSLLHDQRLALVELYAKNPDAAIRKVGNEVCDSCYNEQHIVKWLKWLESTLQRYPLRKHHMNVIVEVYNILHGQSCTDISQIPVNHRAILQSMSEKAMVEAMVVYRYYEKMQPKSEIVAAYSLSDIQFDWIVRKRGAATRRRKGHEIKNKV